MNILLWIIQFLLALLFLWSGGFKLVTPYNELMAMGSPNQVQLGELLMKFIGVCEVLGGLGLVLPGLTRIKPGLTPLAALGLLIIMIGAVVLSAMGDGIKTAIVPAVTGLLLIFVMYGRTKLVPIHGRT